MADRGRELPDEWWINAHNASECTELGGRSLTGHFISAGTTTTESSSYSSRGYPRSSQFSHCSLALFHRQVSSAGRHPLDANAAALSVIRRCQSHHPAWESLGELTRALMLR